MVAESKGSIDTWIQGLTAPTVTVSLWIQPLDAFYSPIVRGGLPSVHEDGQMHLRGWIQGLIVTVGAVSPWIHRSMEPLDSATNLHTG